MFDCGFVRWWVIGRVYALHVCACLVLCDLVVLHVRAFTYTCCCSMCFQHMSLMSWCLFVSVSICVTFSLYFWRLCVRLWACALVSARGCLCVARVCVFGIVRLGCVARARVHVHVLLFTRCQHMSSVSCCLLVLVFICVFVSMFVWRLCV